MVSTVVVVTEVRTAPLGCPASICSAKLMAALTRAPTPCTKTSFSFSRSFSHASSCDCGRNNKTVNASVGTPTGHLRAGDSCRTRRNLCLRGSVFLSLCAASWAAWSLSPCRPSGHSTSGRRPCPSSDGPKTVRIGWPKSESGEKRSFEAKQCSQVGVALSRGRG